MPATFPLDIVTPERTVLADTASSVQLPAVTGSLGILAGHGLITEEMYRVADRYRTIYYIAYPDNERPKAPLPFLAKLPSAPSDLDVPYVKSDERYMRAQFEKLREKLLYACNHAISIDTDYQAGTEAWAGEHNDQD